MKARQITPYLLLKLTLFFWLVGLLEGCTVTRRAKTRKVYKVIETAKSFRGSPHRLGGTTKQGVDCSGLIVCSFEAAGIHLPRTVKAQSKIGKRISVRRLRAGDLLFFATNRSRRKRINHAGIVTKLNGRKGVTFIHASISKGVIESELFSPYYQKAYRRARRVF